MQYSIADKTLALDFPNHGKKLFDLLDRLDQIVLRQGGRVYPAKDGRVSAATFQKMYPNWKEFSEYIDPKFQSEFWKRVSRNV